MGEKQYRVELNENRVPIPLLFLNVSLYFSIVKQQRNIYGNCSLFEHKYCVQTLKNENIYSSNGVLFHLRSFLADRLFIFTKYDTLDCCKTIAIHENHVLPSIVIFIAVSQKPFALTAL